MIDRLNRLEKMGFLRVDDGMRWRETRNRLAHEYPNGPTVRFAAIQAAIQAAEELLGGYRAWGGRLGAG